MFEKLFSRSVKKTSGAADGVGAQLTLRFREEGIVIPRVKPEDLVALAGVQRNQAAYILQLEEEDYLTPLVEGWLLPWEQYFALATDPAHKNSLVLFGLPPNVNLVPVLASEGALSDPSFKVVIRGWRKADGAMLNGPLQRQGAVCQVDGRSYLMSLESWRLLHAVRELARSQDENPGEVTNQVGWASVRKAGKAAGAVVDGFLDRTVVVRPESLRLRLNKSTEKELKVIEVTPQFEDQPEGWLRAFDGLRMVPDHYAIPTPDGGITHVIVAPEVKTVLQEIRTLPGRRVAGDRALQFLRNPYACLGDDANKVLNQEQFERDREESGFSFQRFRLQTNFTEHNRVEAVRLLLEPLSNESAEITSFVFKQASELAPFVHELQVKVAAELPCGFWKGYELELSDFNTEQLHGVEALLERWQREEAGAIFDAVLDLSQYGSRVVGIGQAQKPTSPFLIRDSGQNWLPEALLNSIGLDGALLAKWDTADPNLLEELEQNIVEARRDGNATVTIPGLESTVLLAAAEAVAIAWAEKLRPVKIKPGGDSKQPRSVLQIDDNVEELGYVQARAAALQLASAAHPALPTSLLPSVDLREHQMRGVAWLEHLFQCSPHHASGCLLADDMGLGKTLQLLTFIAWYLEQPEHSDPVLVVAPVSLLENWESELKRFFSPDFAITLKLYGPALSDRKFARSQIPASVTERGIYNLLRPNWRQGAQIVLTTYETLRDQEFSLARQQWGVMVCDEAQKIKNPAALVTQAAKAVPARFKIACTGTPVENSLTDLWCLFDFIQPGHLGALNEFGRKYRQPHQERDENDRKALDELRALIEPQILRRLKSDVAKDLPAKLEHEDCKRLPISKSQLRLYKSEVGRFQEKSAALAELGNQSTTILGLLHTMKMICAHPHAIYPDGDLMDVSPKMRWLVNELERIKAQSEKAIIFTELRDIQRAIQLTLLDHFGINVSVVNGETSASSGKGLSRQQLIDAFQAKPGFGVIILSTTAVGFGVNVQAANHVIHFTRPWNPAKEDQATDRAYRIGQTKDVYVYYPTITSDEFDTFEQKLDVLLARKRALASDMLNGAGDINVLDLAAEEIGLNRSAE